MAREKLPFGALQIGHALRNEISPRQGLIRLREYTIADLEFFFDPEEPDCHLLKDVENESLRLFLAARQVEGIRQDHRSHCPRSLEQRLHQNRMASGVHGVGEETSD